MWETEDPDRRRVILTWPRWLHILHKHPYLAVGREVILGTVAMPDERLPGRETDEEWFYRRTAGPSLWMRVVVHYEHDRGVIVTAFPRRALP